MICKICGSSEFINHAGILYCTECNTQREETRDELAEENFLRRSLLSSPNVEKVSKGKRKKTFNPWPTVECYNFIIFKQVQALISLGASPKLKQTVLYIWSKYLEKCEIAFRRDYNAHESIPRLGPYPSKRDIQVLRHENMLVSSKKNQQNEQSSDEIMSLDSSVNDKCSTDVDPECSSDENFKPKKLKYSSHTRNLQRSAGIKKRNRHAYLYKVFRMTLPKTLSFCYLGLLYTEDQLSLCDLIRLAYEEKIPYINMIDILSQEFKFQDADTNTFLVYSVPDAHTILKMSHKISTFLNLPEFKKPSIFLAVSRFIKELNLPNDLKPIVKLLFEQYKQEPNKNAAVKDVPHDCQALAFIIIALKMLFILDDKFEIEHSEVMTKLNTIKTGHKYFVWTEWKKQACLKEYLFLSENPGYCAINKLDSLSADQMIAKYPYTKLRPPTEEELMNCRNIFVSKNKTMEIFSDVVSVPSESNCLPTSFPLTHEIRNFIKDWKTLPMFKETKEINFTLLDKDFTSDSLSFNTLQFDQEDEELSFLLMSSLYIPSTSALKSDELYLTANQVIRTSSEYWFLNIHQPNKSHLNSDWLDNVPLSFKWLINFVCKYANYNCTVLYQEIIHIEKLLFLQRQRIKSHELTAFQNKLIDF